MTIPEKPQISNTLLELACPYLYRRQGRYTLRVRPKGSKQTITLSLKTTHRQTALAIASQLLGTLRQFHLDKPYATWPELKDNLRFIAESVLQVNSVWDHIRGGSGLIFKDVGQDLNAIALTAPLNIPQTRTVLVGKRLMMAAELNAEGDSQPLLRIIEELDAPEEAQQSPLQVAHTATPIAPVTFKALAGLYMDERKDDLKESSMRSVKTCCETLSDVLGSRPRT